ncbi:MAG: iron ABC transporter permease [Acidimicrobiia bacterium]|nr:iron ABC transporter permease [Acidimicrobiia bacterium]
MTLAADHRKTRYGNVAIVYAALGFGLLVVGVGGLLLGAVSASLGDLWHMIAVKTGLSSDPESLTDSVLWAIRLPRVLAGALVGAGLGVAGVGLQGTFRNELADPHLVGIAPAAGVGALVGIALAPAGGSNLLLIAGAVVGAIALGALMRRLAANTVDPGQLILIGLALGLALLALLGAVVLAWDSPRVPTFNFWIFGGFSGTTWGRLAAALPFVLAGVVGVLAAGRLLDLLALGEGDARHLGVNVRALTTFCLVASGSAIGGSVGLAGVIGFVGLVVPLVLRRVVGPSHRHLAGVSALGGAIALMVLDTAARTIASPNEIPVGLLTAMVGAPVLVWVMLRRTT